MMIGSPGKGEENMIKMNKKVMNAMQEENIQATINE